MPAIDDDDRPKKKITHEIGQELALLSVGELNERIALLKEEIARLEADIGRKQASRSAADQFLLLIRSQVLERYLPSQAPNSAHH